MRVWNTSESQSWGNVLWSEDRAFNLKIRILNSNPESSLLGLVKLDHYTSDWEKHWIIHPFIQSRDNWGVTLVFNDTLYRVFTFLPTLIHQLPWILCLLFFTHTTKECRPFNGSLQSFSYGGKPVCWPSLTHSSNTMIMEPSPQGSISGLLPFDIQEVPEGSFIYDKIWLHSLAVLNLDF